MDYSRRELAGARSAELPDATALDPRDLHPRGDLVLLEVSTDRRSESGRESEPAGLGERQQTKIAKDPPLSGGEEARDRGTGGDRLHVGCDQAVEQPQAIGAGDLEQVVVELDQRCALAQRGEIGGELEDLRRRRFSAQDATLKAL